MANAPRRFVSDKESQKGVYQSFRLRPTCSLCSEIVRSGGEIIQGWDSDTSSDPLGRSAGGLNGFMGDRPTVPDRSIAYFKLASINTSCRKLLVVTSSRHQSNHSTIVVISSTLLAGFPAWPGCGGKRRDQRKS